MVSGVHPDESSGRIPNQSSSSMQSLSPEQVRSLRGDASRAAFARRVGVTPNTVYRWELPDGAAEARRPRGTELEKLSRLLEQPEMPEPASPAQAMTSSTTLGWG